MHHHEADAELLLGHTKHNHNFADIAKQSQAPAQKWQGCKNSQAKAQAVVATLDAAFGKSRRR